MSRSRVWVLIRCREVAVKEGSCGRSVYSVHTKVVVHAFPLFSNFSLQYSLSIAWIALDNPPEALVEPQDPPQLQHSAVLAKQRTALRSLEPFGCPRRSKIISIMSVLHPGTMVAPSSPFVRRARAQLEPAAPCSWHRPSCGGESRGGGGVREGGGGESRGGGGKECFQRCGFARSCEGRSPRRGPRWTDCYFSAPCSGDSRCDLFGVSVC